jgi:hypothetical protein
MILIAINCCFRFLKKFVPIIPKNRPQIAPKIIAILSIVLASCGSTPPTPDWQLNAHSGLQRFTQAYLAGHSGVAEVEFNNAKSEIAATGKPVLIARAELIRCAARTASLELNDCPGARAMQADLGVAESAYLTYLSATHPPPPGSNTAHQLSALASQLPEAHRAVLQSRDDGARVASLQGMADPVARLIAAAVLLRQNQLPPAGVDLVVETASEQGWRRPLLAWLTVQFKIAQAAGRTPDAERIQRRIAVASGG